MTTKVVIECSEDGNPDKEIVVIGHQVSGPGLTVLKPGEKGEWWLADGSLLSVVERKA